MLWNRLVFALAVMLLAVPRLNAEETPTEPARPNFLVIVTDDQRFDQLGIMHPTLKTPNLDRLAREGTWFQNSFVTTSICAASRASILTGCVERTHGYTFGTPPLAKRFTANSYPALLRNAGYWTGFVGKFGVGTTSVAKGRMFDSCRPMGQPYEKKQKDGSQRHLTDLEADEAIRLLGVAAQTEKPFCLSLSFNAPHAADGDKRQYIYPPEYNDLYAEVEVPPPALGDDAFFQSQPKFLRESMNRDRWPWRFDTPEKYQQMVKGYWRMITHVDAAVGRVLAELEEQGVAENTIVIVIGDNGYFLGERGFVGKWLPYNLSLRVPLLVYDPTVAKAQRHSKPEQIVLNIDLAPTMLDYAGVAVPGQMQGRSLAPLVRGQEVSDWRSDFFCEHLMQHRDIPKHEGVRELTLRYSRYFEQQPVYEELFDLKKDPQETNNLVDDLAYREELERLRARTDELRAAYEQAADD